MLVIHNGKDAVHHVIFVHPPNYHEELVRQGLDWVEINEHIGIHNLKLSRHPETNDLQFHHHPAGGEPRLLEHMTRADILEQQRQDEAERERVRQEIEMLDHAYRNYGAWRVTPTLKV